MASWKFFEWLAYASILVGAVILAADAALKGSPTLMPHLPDWIKSEYWSFAPFALLMLSGAIFLAKAIRARVGTSGRLSPPGHAPSQPAGDNASLLPSQRLSARRETASISAPVPSLLSLEQALVPQDAYYLPDEDAKGYPHKLKIVLTNESAGAIVVTPAEWENTCNFTLPPLNEHPWQLEGPHGWQNKDWGEETHEPLLVRSGRAIQTWVGLPAPLDKVQLRRRIMTKRLGTLIVPLTVDGNAISETIRL